MKKILEILQYGDNDIRFKTDLEIEKNPEMVLELTSRFAWAMITSLWGGNERSVIAIIRALEIADMAVSVNRKEMVRQLDESSEMLAKSMQEARQMMEREGVRFTLFAPGVQPPKMRS